MMRNVRIEVLVVVDADNRELGNMLILITYFVAHRYVFIRCVRFVGIKCAETVDMDLGRLLARK